jgi:3-oxoacyl-ACP reductase-like protein
MVTFAQSISYDMELCMKLQNKVVLVTGASKGIGAAIAIEAAREGAQVIINYADRSCTGRCSGYY